MRAIVQRVNKVDLSIDNNIYSSINKGLLVFLAIHKNDTLDDLNYILKKVLGLRIFEDDNNKMNLSLKDIAGEIMIVSQFTLYGDVRKGFRPSFTESASGEFAENMYEKFIELAKKEIDIVKTGNFGADMKINLINDGPVTIQIDSSKLY